MSALVNRQVVLAARPTGMAKAADFRLETTPVPEPGPGQVLVRNIWMSVDPYMRGRMNDRKSYAPPFEVGKPLDGRAVGQVLKSNHPKLRLLNPQARVPLCGMISQYNLEIPDPGPRYLFSMIANRALMQGFIISDHFDRYGEFVGEVGGWLKQRSIKSEETVVEGIENAPKAFLGLFSGDNLGEMVVRLAPDPK